MFDNSQSIHMSQLRYDGKIGTVAMNFCNYMFGENRLILVEEVAALMGFDFLPQIWKVMPHGQWTTRLGNTMHVAVVGTVLGTALGTLKAGALSPPPDVDTPPKPRRDSSTPPRKDPPCDDGSNRGAGPNPRSNAGGCIVDHSAGSGDSSGSNNGCIIASMHASPSKQKGKKRKLQTSPSNPPLPDDLQEAVPIIPLTPHICDEIAHGFHRKLNANTPISPGWYAILALAERTYAKQKTRVLEDLRWQIMASHCLGPSCSQKAVNLMVHISESLNIEDARRKFGCMEPRCPGFSEDPSQALSCACGCT
jgi:hypothetical protein